MVSGKIRQEIALSPAIGKQSARRQSHSRLAAGSASGKSADGIGTKSRSRVQTKFLRQLPLHLMLLPAVVLVLIYTYIPMFGYVMAFEDFDPGLGFLKSQWVGFDNITYLFSLPDLKQVVFNTVFIACMKIIAESAAAILLALLLNEVANRLLRRSVQTILYFPHFLSWVILGGILRDTLSLNGFINAAISFLQIKPIWYLGNNAVFPFVLISSHVWQQAGFGTIVYLACITGINPALYEAAAIDGAGHFSRMLHVTLPGMKSMIILMATLSLGNVLDAGFGQVYSLYSPIVYKSGDILDTWVYRMGLLNAQYSLSSAVDLLKSGVSLVLMSASCFLAYKFSDYRIF
jgi:putative aldouronate transport system permease protein